MKQAVTGWITGRSPRERMLAVAALVVVLGALIDAALLAPQRDARDALRRQVQDTQRELARLQSMAVQHTLRADAAEQARTAALAARRRQAEEAIRAAQVDLIAPQDMGRQLSALLARHPQLRVVSMSTQPPVPLIDVAAGAAPAQPAEANGLFQHGIELTVEGRYLDLVAWLQSLEKAPYRIYWRTLDLQVNADGVPVTKVALFTLSREAVWMRL